MVSPRAFRISVAVLAAGLAGSAGAAEVEVGAVFQPEFNGALGQLVTGNQHDLVFGETVYLDETVTTGPGSSTALLFLDQTRLQVGASSTVILDRFVYDPDAGKGSAIIDFGQGIFRFISGDMPKEQVVLRTPTTVMAIRGTTLIIYVAPDDTTQVAVISGEVAVSPCGGEAVTAVEGFSASISGDCSETAVVPGVITPLDPAVMADLDLSGIAPAAGPAPGSNSDDHGPSGAAGASGNGGGNSGGGDPGGGDPGGGDPGGGDPGGGDQGGRDPAGNPGGGDSGAGDPGGGDPGPGNGNGNGGNPGSGGGNTGGSGPGTGNGGPGTGNGGSQRGGQNANNVGQNGNQNGNNAGQND